VAVGVYVEYFDTEGSYYTSIFTTYNKYTSWLKTNCGVRVMKVKVH